MELRSVIGEVLLDQHRARYYDLHRATARERYELLLRRCPGIVHHLALQDLASFPDFVKNLSHFFLLL